MIDMAPCSRLLSLIMLIITGFSSSVDFPPMISSDDIAYFFENDDLDGLHWALSNVFRRSERNTLLEEIIYPLSNTINTRCGGLTYTTAYKLKMDIEQAEYLSKVLKDKEMAKFFHDDVLPKLKAVYQNIPQLNDLEHTGGLYGFRKHDFEQGIGEIYNKALYLPKVNELRHSNGELIPLLSDTFDGKSIEEQWYDQSSTSTGIVVIDDVLSPRALATIRELLLQSTVFYQTKMPLKFGGYVGAYIDDGLHDRILLQLAFELHKSLPNIMEGNALKYLWCYKYDSEYSGINTHADQAVSSHIRNYALLHLLTINSQNPNMLRPSM